MQSSSVSFASPSLSQTAEEIIPLWPIGLCILHGVSIRQQVTSRRHTLFSIATCTAGKPGPRGETGRMSKAAAAVPPLHNQHTLLFEGESCAQLPTSSVGSRSPTRKTKLKE